MQHVGKSVSFSESDMKTCVSEALMSFCLEEEISKGMWLILISIMLQDMNIEAKTIKNNQHY